MRRREFERLVARALESLPDVFKERLEDVVVIIEDWPAQELLDDLGMPEDETLMGYYEGTPLTDFGRDYSMRLPDRIYVFKGPIEEACDTPAEVEEEILKTVMHEVGHFFGLSEEEVEHL